MEVSISIQQQIAWLSDWLAVNLQIVAVGILLFLLAWWLLRRVIRWLTPDPVRREFQRVGIQPTREQVETLRDAFATITSAGAQQELQSRLDNQSAIQGERAQLDRVKQLSQAHIEIVREVGAALRAIEAEYARSCKTLTSEQAKEALRLIVERSVAEITQMSHASANKLPEFNIHPPQSQNGHATSKPVDSAPASQ